ncbi:autotransporter assembly complex protein TamA [Shewanella gelidii]|uniref:Translocation and assembly module subunit TamA n=1 Tax=Shewanella gelidii TaxID=1642821 RepID=A0A917JUE8_9GAMM|nr:autotransporter assembly complex family protein [Shewanella gelidii]MCL1097932.1 autotransporter assembly complex protein TamA [Shewanella gelidii]GGI84801.1 outer membrane protein assembly factor [Shewanella gelidii]
MKLSIKIQSYSLFVFKKQPILIILVLTIASLFSGVSAADKPWLEVQISGVNSQIERNIRAHLGDLPDSKVLRRAFLFNAEEKIEAALQALGYYHANLTQQISKTSPTNWQLTLDIALGEPTRLQWVDIAVNGEMQQDPVFERWLNQLQIKPLDILNHGQYDALKSQLVGLALSQGYFDGLYTTSEIKINRDTKTAQINLAFESGRRYVFGNVTFKGSDLETGFLQQLVPFPRDTPYSSSQLSTLNSRLLNTGYFSSIKVLPQVEQAQHQQLPVRVELSPRPDHAFEIGLGADIGNTTENTVEPRVRFTWRTPQINKKGHSQETTLEWSPERPKFLTTYTIPLSHPIDDQLKLRVGLLRDKYGVTQEYNSTKRAFEHTGELESSKRLLALVRQQRLDSRWLWAYSVETIREFYTQQDIEYDPKMLLFGTSISKVVRGDNSLDPKSGFRQYYSIEYADPALGSSIRLTRLLSKFKWVDTFYEKHRLVSRMDLGINFAKDEQLAHLAPSLRFFAGGDQSIRGYSYQELGPSIDYTDENGTLTRQVIGGRYLAVASLEYQYYVTPNWRVGTFIDGGNAFDKKEFDPVVSVGAGVHWISPIGPIKLDVGVGLEETDTLDRPWRIHLTMGAEI